MTATDNEQKISQVLESIEHEIAERERKADSAMRVIERFSTTAEEYNNANIRFGANSYIACYLRHIKEAIQSELGTVYPDIRKVESCLRSHHFQQTTKCSQTDSGYITTAQFTLADILGKYLDTFFA